MDTKYCPRCESDLPLESFGSNKFKKDGLQSICKICDCAYKKQTYKNNSEVLKERSKKRRSEIYAWFAEYKKTLRCKKCGDERWYVLDFHHKDFKEKEGNVSHMVRNGFSKKRILGEANKCDILCSNCHRELHHEISSRIKLDAKNAKEKLLTSLIVLIL